MKELIEKYKPRVTLFVFLFVFFTSESLYAYCAAGTGQWDTSDLPLPVYLNNNLDDLICSTSNCSNIENIRNSTEATLDEFYDSSGSDLNLSYAGTTNADIGEVINGSIHIFASQNCFDAPGVAAWADSNGDGKVDYGKIRMCSQFNGRAVAWNSFPDSSSTFNLSWQGVMAQEVGHTLGFDHPSDCNQNFKSIMGTTTATSHHGHHLYKDDIDAYQTRYGFRNDKSVNFKTSHTGIDWGNTQSLNNTMKSALSRFSVCNTSSSPTTFVSFPADQIPRLVDLWRYGAGGWIQLPSPWFAASNYHTGTACKDENTVAVAWSGGYDTITGEQDIFLSTTTNAGNNWGIERIADGANQTRNAGVSAAFDPESGQYIVMWRDNRDRITSKINAPASPIRQYAQSNNSFLRASDSVSIACGPASVVGAENCIVAWPDVGWDRTLRWAHAHVDMTGGTPELVIGSIRSQGYIIYGTPSVSYWSTGEYPWALVFHQGGRTAYSLRKKMSNTAQWQNESNFSAGQKIVSPVSGSRTGPTVEGDDVILQFLHALFSSS